MKKLFIVACALLVAGAANAQIGPRFGIKGGANFANIIKTGDNNFETDRNTGFHAGLFLNIPIVDRLSFQPEVLYSQKGFENNNTGVVNRTFKQKSAWVDVPILAKINATKSFHVVIGPQVSFLSKTTNTYSDNFVTTEQTAYENDTKNLKKSIVGGVFGIGFDVGRNIGLYGRYTLDLQKNNENGSSQIPQYRNQVLQAGLALGF